MDHSQFKANQTAAGYVANGLDEPTQEAFELHMMGCTECVADVEVWRAISHAIPRERPAQAAPGRAVRWPVFTEWRMAASLLGAGVIGAAGGWLGKATTATDLDSTRTVVFNLPSVSRGAGECTAVPLAPDTRLAVLRVPGLPRDVRVVALNSDKQLLPAAAFASRIQPDGSQLLQIDAASLAGREVRLQSQQPDGATDPVGCIAGE